ncbi:PREDICTED: sodium/potassium/calcium exchanger 3-like [Ceratosolen solmsi marchali]|uniref:Sodium/potassium/calcium exchanger 3-like n=1 Tax=Ceratosolen solmsi marchali TaxID=326594 RepID=A0AAJ6YKI6_9HYME|nr:PREDICTED: sodium/potassium/calcium exchanger 3-like [Ceratosolen solmsi marchali]
MGRRGQTLGIRLVQVLAIPTLYCLFSGLAALVPGDTSAGLSGEPSFISKFRGAEDRQFFSKYLEFQGTSRKLLQVNDTNTPVLDLPRNCTPPSIHEFPSDGFTREQRQNGYIIIHFITAIYSFFLLAIVCDDFFVPSITKICERIGVSKDVAGATFMAAASSSPELFINIVGTFVTEGDLGVGTIVGSAVFNILAVPALCGLFASQALSLDWWPVSRDSLAYGVTVLLLIFTLYDGRIEWYEAFLLVVTYILYILAMFFNTRIISCLSIFSSKRRRKYKNLNEDCPLIGKDKFHNSFIQSKSNNNFFTNTKVKDMLYETENCSKIVNVENFEESSDFVEIVNMTSWPNNGFERCWWILTWPINAILLITIPDCRRPVLRKWYPLTFLMCIVWIAVMSYLVGWNITVIGDTLTIPDSVMGLTFLAAGMSVPEGVSSVIVTNQGHGTMGISNSIGSNVFDVLLCLGLPWFVKAAFYPSVSDQHFVKINSEGLIYSSVSLMSTLLILYGVLALNRFKLDRKVGIICLSIYSIFLILASLIELNVFFVVNRPTCPH